ncbi:unnamed protein product, partial [Rotaria magnacalcarata]
TELDRCQKNLNDKQRTYDGIKSKHEQKSQHIQQQTDLKARIDEKINRANTEFVNVRRNIGERALDLNSKNRQIKIAKEEI